MSAKILFLDLDGTLNDHAFDEAAQSSTILARCVGPLNRVLDATDCRIVLTSAWRYMVLEGAMTLRGFEYLLRTHRIHAKGRLIGTTRLDWEPGVRPTIERGRQCREWLHAHCAAWRGFAPGATWAIGGVAAIDDEDFGYTVFDVPLVRTDGKVGLTDADADRAITLLGGSP